MLSISFQSHLIRHWGTRYKFTDAQSVLTFKTLGKHSDIWALGGHSGTQALRALSHSDTQGTSALAHLGTLFSRLVSNLHYCTFNSKLSWVRPAHKSLLNNSPLTFVRKWLFLVYITVGDIGRSCRIEKHDSQKKHPRLVIVKFVRDIYTIDQLD